MKKISIFLLLLTSAVMGFASQNYFTMGENGVLRISPNSLGGTVDVPVRLHLAGRIDNWNITCTNPSDLTPTNASDLSGMTDIPYLNASGISQTYNATLIDYNSTIFSSTIDIFGYWDPDGDGTYTPYGTVKWEAGDHDMFFINYMVHGDCTGDTIRISGSVSSTYDWRGGTENGTVSSEVLVRVAYKLGDVNGDESVNIVDATTLINYISAGNVQLNSYQLAAADINGDGQVNIADATLLINIINGSSNFAGMEDIDDPVASILGSSSDIPVVY